ncbi:hypothetical protein LSH36_37g15022 [Paralvinella palmiformis]|uniref:GPI alpha-1,4-mannosyltransferase I, catalytic subunit n=1 Tax=Paralvinella palmiformis TaxID=53620 RepID=A0AAD9K8F3_9ANNE|nr:hypothetical protein LSH36_37g15022 [Paralvinella palmiformis]
MKTIVSTLLVGVVTRLGLMLYGLWQDSVMAVKYTDVDYYVFTDAAKFMVKGESPYRRATYRYTPLLAWILQPNVWWSPIYGKILFILCDVFAGYLIYCILKKNHDVNTAHLCAQTWLLNPLPIVVSSRGNAECGIEFIQETYLYHVTRRDTRHNFSPYFYMLYLTGDSQISMALGLVAFIPQVALLLIISFSFYKDLPFCCFLHTFIFVSFNKVCTSQKYCPMITFGLFEKILEDISAYCHLIKLRFDQYFLWYLCILPLIIPRLYISLKEACFLILLWFGGQSMWLLPAYYLEFNGQNTFILIWMAGLMFLGINVWILHRFIHSYQPIMESRTALLNIKEKCP